LLDGGSPLAALDLTLYEVANAATCGWGAPAEADKVVALVQEACAGSIVRVDADLARHSIALAAEHSLSVYDAAYVAAARSRGWTLVSGDHKDLVKPGLAIAPETAAAG